MADLVNYSLKIDSEVKNSLLTKISESSLTAGEFLGTLLATYEAAQSQESLFDVRELQQMENHLIRVKEIYIGLAKRLKDEQTDHQLTKERLLRDIETAQADIMNAKETAEKELETAKNRITELERELRGAQENEKQSRDLAAASTAILKTQQEQIAFLQGEIIKLREMVNIKREQPTMEITSSKETVSDESPDGQAETISQSAEIIPPETKPKKSKRKNEKTVADSQHRADERLADDIGKENSIIPG